jgi:DNA-binding transcriptional MerR regulator
MSAAGKKNQSSKPGLRMNELVKETGVPKSTILHYLNQGLLPEPQKTSPNMAYYDPACVGRIQYIQHLQHRHRLSLSEIKQVLAQKGRNLDFSRYAIAKCIRILCNHRIKPGTAKRPVRSQIAFALAR